MDYLLLLVIAFTQKCRIIAWIFFGIFTSNACQRTLRHRWVVSDMKPVSGDGCVRLYLQQCRNGSASCFLDTVAVVQWYQDRQFLYNNVYDRLTYIFIFYDYYSARLFCIDNTRLFVFQCNTKNTMTLQSIYKNRGNYTIGYVLCFTLLILLIELFDNV